MAGGWLYDDPQLERRVTPLTLEPFTIKNEALKATHRTTTADLTDRPDEVTAALLRPLLRDLGTETVLDVKFEDRAAARQ